MKKIYEIKYGSQAYGTQTPTSDLDIRGIMLPSVDEALGLKEFRDVSSKKVASKCCHEDTFNVAPPDDNMPSLHCSKCKQLCEGIDIDSTFYPIHKFFRLALQCNPSVLEWLFVPNSNGCIITMTPEAKIIRDNRLLFLSKEIYPRFKGYAYSELTRLTKINGATGAKRRDTVLELGYNSKSAMNIIRLLDEATELLNTASLTLPLRNAQELKKIKAGKYTYKEVLELYEQRLKLLDEAYANTKLPQNSRREDAEYILVNIIKNQNE